MSEIGMDVADSGGYAPGAFAQRVDGELLLSAGTLGDANAMFGIVNDQNGLQLNAYPIPAGLLCRCYMSWYVVPTYSGMYSLRGDITLDRVAAPGSDTVVENICDRREYVWWFSYSGWYEGLYLNDFTSGWHFAGTGGPGTGFLRAGSYRIKVYWWSYAVAVDCHSFNAIDTKYFYIAEEQTEVTLGPYPKHTNTTEHEW